MVLIMSKSCDKCGKSINNNSNRILCKNCSYTICEIKGCLNVAAGLKRRIYLINRFCLIGKIPSELCSICLEDIYNYFYEKRKLKLK
jgi:hypothetical protein